MTGCPVTALADARVELRRAANASSAAYLPLHNDAMSVRHEVDRAELVDRRLPVLVREVGADLLGDRLEHRQLAAEVGDRDVELVGLAIRRPGLTSSGPGTVVPVAFS